MNFLGKVLTKLAGFSRKYSVALPVEATPEDVECIHACSSFTMTSTARLWATITSTKYLVNNNIRGAFVECGVWRGGNAMAMAKTLASLNAQDREIYLFDTFLGMTEPTELDLDSSGKTAKKLLLASSKQQSDSIWCVSGLQDVKANLASTFYPSELLHYRVGDVLNTLQAVESLPKEIALLRLDTDWYESTKKELEVLFPRLVVGGVCLIDDYGHWQGARKAVDDYFADHNIYPLIHVTDYTGRAFIKK